jgi:hypothetical protein
MKYLECIKVRNLSPNTKQLRSDIFCLVWTYCSSASYATILGWIMPLSSQNPVASSFVLCFVLVKDSIQVGYGRSVVA